ncbi:MAG: hypothetical protein Q4B23_02620 [Helcococcus sp.]|nr:hypothetical protein [Helcococcus sp.]
MEIRIATMADLKKILLIYEKAREFMRNTNNPNQWGINRPEYESVVTDIKHKRMYTIIEEKEIIGVFSLYDYDKDYEQLEEKWLNNEPYVAIHKIASTGKKGGIFNTALEFAKTKSNNIRIDTHKFNKIMQLNIKRNGFKYIGIVYIEGKYERLAYHLVIK